MGTRKLIDKNIRTLMKLGGTSIGVTLPIEYLTRLKWKARQKVVVKQQGKRLIIEDWKG